MDKFIMALIWYEDHSREFVEGVVIHAKEIEWHLINTTRMCFLGFFIRDLQYVEVGKFGRISFSIFL